MAKNLTTTELRKMQPDDLRKEVETKMGEIAKMRLGIAVQSFKDTAKFSRDKKELARMKTVQREQSAMKELKEAVKASTVPASTN